MKSQVSLISISRCFRSFIFTYIALISPFFLSSVGLGTFDIAIVLFLSILVATLFSLFIPRSHVNIRIRIILPASLLTVGLTVLVFLHTATWFIIAMLISGTAISGKDQSANRPVEQYLIASYKEHQPSRNAAFSRYNFLSYLGAFMASTLVFLQVPHNFGDIFILLAIVSLVPLSMNILVSTEGHEEPKRIALDEKTQRMLARLVPLFMLDSLGGGMMSQSLITLWFKEMYSVSISTIGLIFLIAEVITAFSVLASSRLSTRFGLVNTMVSTHILSSAFLILILVMPVLLWSVFMLFLRQAFSEMDVPARESLTNTIIDKKYRVTTNSILQSSKYVSTIPGPVISAYILSVAGFLVLPIAGMIKIAYDLIFYGYFRDSENLTQTGEG